jgi:16S rRNA (guanine527-N7)-methyltransferase
MGREDFSAQLIDACERMGRKLDLVFEEESLRDLVIYAEELRFWNRAYNLVGRKIGTEGLVSLIIDALSPLSLKGLLEKGKEVVDIGSGAGLPGIPLYLLAGPFSLTAVEAQRKKITFLRHICRKLNLEGVKLYPGRLEDMVKDEDHLSAYEIGLARAVMDPLRLLKAARPLISEGGKLVVFVGEKDGEGIRKKSLELGEKGLKVESVRSMQRVVGKENYLAVIRKTKP